VSYKLKAALRSAIVPEVGPLPTSFTRNLPAFVVDHEGVMRLTPANAARFTGARYVEQLMSNPSFDTWTSGVPNNCTRGANATFTQVPGRTGTGSALRMSATTAGNVGNNRVNILLPAAMTVGRRIVISAWVRRSAGSAGPLNYAIDSTGTFVLAPTASVDGTWRRFASAPVTILTPNSTPGLYANVAGDEFEIDDVQVEDITLKGCVMPSEWISKGALAFPYHGAGADGAKFFETANGNTWDSSTQLVSEAVGSALSSTVEKRGYIPADGAGDFSTPTNAKFASVSSMEIVVRARSMNWGSAAGQVLIARDPGGPPRSWILRQAANTRNVEFLWSLDGSGTPAASIAVPFLDGEEGFIRVIWAANGTCQVGYSRVGINGPWTMSGTFAVAAGTMWDSGQVFQVGRRGSGVQSLSEGWVKRALVYVNGTLALDFNPDSHTAGNTWLSLATGETWTRNGSAVITNNPMRRYRKERAATNGCLMSSTFDDAAWLKQGSGVALAPVVTADFTTAPDGTKTADRVVFDLNGGTTTSDISNLIQSFIYTSGLPFLFAVWLKSNTTSNVVMSLVVFNSQSGNITVTPFWQRFVWTVTPNASVGSTFGARVRGGQGMTTPADISIWSGYHEQTALVPTSDIPTTTVAVTRPEDLLFWPLSVFSDAEGTASALAEPDAWTNADASNRRVIGGGTAAEAGTPLFGHIGGGFGSYDVSTATPTVGVTPSAGAHRGTATWRAGGIKKAYNDGVAVNAGNAYDGSYNLTAIGIGIGGSLPWQGNIGEVLILDTALSEFDVPKLPNYVYPTLADPIAGACSYPPLQAGMVNAPVLLGSITQPVAIVGVVK
jgi:hypothetical protein